MASFRIHEDQENRGICELRQKRTNMAPVQQKRAILGLLDNQQNKPKGKLPLGFAKVQAGNDNLSLKQVAQKPPPPVVPVAQFEAFKVYEDLKENEVGNRPNRKAVEALPTKNDVEGAKKEWFVKDTKLDVKCKPKEDLVTKHEENDREQVSTEHENDTPTKEIPMSLEKPLEDVSSKLVMKGKSNKDIFFENEEYSPEIYLYLRELERHNRPKAGYMLKQPDITYNMRTILVDWLVEVAKEYNLQSETLYLAINYTDRFLSYMSVVRGKLQLVGTAAMFIAAKYEEIYPPDINEFVYITDYTYTKKQVIRMEHLILKVLAFDLSIPTPLTFITAICIATCMPEKVMFFAMYLSELSMLETDTYLETLPSLIAAGAVAVARCTFKMEPWSTELKRKTGYDVKELKKTMEFLYILFCKAPTQSLQAIQEKYDSTKYMHVSKLNPRNEELKLN